MAAVAELAQGRALIAHLNLEIEKLRRTIYGPRSERTARLLDQLELRLEEAEANAAEDDLAAEHTKPSTTVRSFARKRAARKPFPDHLPRERVVVPAPQSCPCCGSAKLSKLGEDITETLEVIPRQWKVIQTVRERFSCRECETITQPPALSRHNAVAKAIDYMLTRWPAFSRFLEDGRICLTNNAAERALRGLALGRKSWLFAGSERGAERAAIMYTLIQTAKLNDIDPQAWLADTLSKIAETPQTRLGKLLPWNWMSDRRSRAAA